MRPLEWYDGAIAALAAAGELEGMPLEAKAKIDGFLYTMIRERLDAQEQHEAVWAERDDLALRLVSNLATFAIETLDKSKPSSGEDCSAGS